MMIGVGLPFFLLCPVTEPRCICRGKSTQTVSELLKASASTTVTNKLGLTPLAEAIVSGRVDNAHMLLDKVHCLLLCKCLCKRLLWKAIIP